MKQPRIDTPTVQNWSCHGCTDCCRGQLVHVSTEEKTRLEKQGWTEADGVNPAALLAVEGTGFRLGHQSSGACVFLDSVGHCRIHAKFGEAAKPLACRLYPFVVHPAGEKFVVGLRFSCPSAAQNRGRPLAEQRGEIQKLAGLVVPNDYREFPPPPIVSEPGEWPDFLRFVKWLDASLAENGVPLALKLLRTLHWLKAVEKGLLDQISGADADEILEALIRSAAEKIPALPEDSPAPSGYGRVSLRMSVLEFARKVTFQDLHTPGPSRWKGLLIGVSLLRPAGRTPAWRDELASVPFRDIEKPFGPPTPEVESMLARYFRVKIQSLHFCGRAFHDRPLIEGFRSLALLFPAIVWVARWLAVSDRRTQVLGADVARAISMLDDRYCYTRYSSRRVQLLQRRDDIVRLCVKYAN